jgi:hypothetical protein
VTALAVLIIVTGTSVSVGPDGSLPLLVWLVGVIATVLLLGLSLSGIRRSYRGHYLKSWWNLGNKAEEPSWPDVLAMTAGEIDIDPIAYVRTPRATTFFAEGLTFVAVVTTLCIFLEMLSLLSLKTVMDLFKTEIGKIIDFGQNLTAYLALVAAIATIYFAHRQLQAKVKADSRQAWIDKLRGNIARFIALVDTVHYEPHSASHSKRREKITACRIELEMMLNPSEKDHRLLMYLTIKLALFEYHDSDLMEIQDVDNIVKVIEAQVGSDREKWSSILAPIPPENDLDREAIYGRLIGYTIRLSHVVLKREWERVKATR